MSSGFDYCFWPSLAQRERARQRNLFSRRHAPELCKSYSPKKEGAGKPGVRCTRGRAWCVINTRVSHHRFTGSIRLSLRNGFNGFLRALPGDRACLPPSLRVASAELDTSVGASGPHDFAVRVSTVRPRTFVHRRCRVHRIPHPTSVTIAKRPSLGAGRRGNMEVIWVGREGKYFWGRGLDRWNHIDPPLQISVWRKWSLADLNRLGGDFSS